MKILKKTLVTLAGGALLLAGIAMVELPGPAFVVIPVALAILAVEFVWARRGWPGCASDQGNTSAQPKHPFQSSN